MANAIYGFQGGIAAEVGLEAAIVIELLRHWIWNNRSLGRNFYDGHTWTYNSARGWAESLFFWKAQKVYRILRGLEKAGIIITGNYNKSGYDRTLWYAFSDEEYWIGKQEPVLPRSGFIYLVAHGELIKIGITSKPKERIASLRKSFDGLRLLHLFEITGFRAAERRFHEAFAAQRDHGEWFRLSEDDIRSIEKSIIDLGGIHSSPETNGIVTDDEPIPSSLPNKNTQKKDTSPAVAGTFRPLMKFLEELHGGQYANYKKEGPALSKLIERVGKMYPEGDAEERIRFMAEYLRSLSAGHDKFWKGMPVSPSSLLCHWDRLFALAKAKASAGDWEHMSSPLAERSEG